MGRMWKATECGALECGPVFNSAQYCFTGGFVITGTDTQWTHRMSLWNLFEQEPANSDGLKQANALQHVGPSNVQKICEKTTTQMINILSNVCEWCLFPLTVDHFIYQWRATWDLGHSAHLWSTIRDVSHNIHVIFSIGLTQNNNKYVIADVSFLRELNLPYILYLKIHISAIVLQDTQQ